MLPRAGWIASAGAALLLAGCGSEQNKMERGIAVDREVAVPESEKELAMTEAERRAAEREEEKQREARRLEEDAK